LAHGIDNRRSFFDSARQWLLHVNVFARSQGIDCDSGMPVIGSRDDDGVEAGDFENLAVIVDEPRTWRERLSLFGACLPQIANYG
jgi:hypothetical protein